jgi:hypothetical protein
MDPVTTRLSVSKEKLIVGENFEITVDLGVKSGYEIHSIDASPPEVPTQLELELPAGFSVMEDWRSPSPIRSLKPGGGWVHVGENQFVRKIHVAADSIPGEYSLACSVSFQACNSWQCLRPTKSLLNVKISVSR